MGDTTVAAGKRSVSYSGWRHAREPTAPTAAAQGRVGWIGSELSSTSSGSPGRAESKVESPPCDRPPIGLETEGRGVGPTTAATDAPAVGSELCSPSAIDGSEAEVVAPSKHVSAAHGRAADGRSVTPGAGTKDAPDVGSEPCSPSASPCGAEALVGEPGDRGAIATSGRATVERGERPTDAPGDAPDVGSELCSPSASPGGAEAEVVEPLARPVPGTPGRATADRGVAPPTSAPIDVGSGRCSTSTSANRAKAEVATPSGRLDMIPVGRAAVTLGTVPAAGAKNPADAPGVGSGLCSSSAPPGWAEAHVDTPPCGWPAVGRATGGLGVVPTRASKDAPGVGSERCSPSTPGGTEAEVRESVARLSEPVANGRAAVGRGAVPTAASVDAHDVGSELCSPSDDAPCGTEAKVIEPVGCIVPIAPGHPAEWRGEFPRAASIDAPAGVGSGRCSSPANPFSGAPS
jgi:hypothetical protein